MFIFHGRDGLCAVRLIILSSNESDLELGWDWEGRIQHQFLEDREGWIRCRSAETGAGSASTTARFIIWPLEQEEKWDGTEVVPPQLNVRIPRRARLVTCR